ncbi:TPA: DUF6890 family protein [Klebsiella michiganensis]
MRAGAGNRNKKIDALLAGIRRNRYEQLVTLRRHFLPAPSDADEPADSLLNLARAAWLAEYHHERDVNATAAAIAYALTGKR